MKFDPIVYKRFDRNPVGCFSAELTDDGWAKTMFDHDLQEHLRMFEVDEFIKLVRSFFHEVPDWKTLQKFNHKYGAEIRTDDGTKISAVNFIGNMMDYTFKVNGIHLEAYPYRKIQH